MIDVIRLEFGKGLLNVAGSPELWIINPLELSKNNLVNPLPFIMLHSIGKVRVEYHEPVRIHKVMDSSATASSYKSGYI